MNRSVYFRDDVFLRIKQEAEDRGLTINAYLTQIADPLGPIHPVRGRLAEIEKKIDELCGYCKKIHDSERPGKIEKKLDLIIPHEPTAAKSDSEILAAAQAKLDEKRKGRDIKKEKIAKVKAAISFNPQPKAKWKK